MISACRDFIVKRAPALNFPQSAARLDLKAIATAIVALLLLAFTATQAGAEGLPGTQPLEMEGDLASHMVDGIDKFLLRETAASTQAREAHWKRDTSSPEKYAESVVANRERFKTIIGAADQRVEPAGLEFVGSTKQPALVGKGKGFSAYAVRWPVFRNVTGEGLLLKPTGREPSAYCVAIPDADQTPEMLCGLMPGIEPENQFARRLAESGCLVVIPMLINRDDTHSVTGAGRKTNQPHREFVYRPAFEMGRHIIGYEVQTILAAVDSLVQAGGERAPIGVMGYGEGGLLSLYAGAADPRIDVTVSSGYFGPREAVWQEPIYRNVFALLHEFGDAELASLIAPRTLIVEASQSPQISGPPAPHDGRGGAAPGVISTPELAAVQQEIERAETFFADSQAAPRIALVGDGSAPAGSPEAVALMIHSLLEPTAELDAAAALPALAAIGEAPTHERKDFDPRERHKRQFDQLLEDTQHLMRESEYVRRDFFSKTDRSSVDTWKETTAPYRKHFYDEVIGRFGHELLPPNARTRVIYDEPTYTGYEVVMDVWDDVFAYGILLLPKDIKEGERRPVVVCQHGLEGRPQDVADPKFNNPAYNQFACRLAERGFITYAPQNPYIFMDRFRTLQRKANPLKKSLFSIIVPQHQQTVDWLAGLPMVDPERIGFYGLSYGGKTAMRVPPLVDRYCLSICSADFNEWIWKNASTRASVSYVGTMEYEIFEFNLGNTYNYAEMAGLIAPRPFMVERGHHDGVAPDEWVAYEYAKVRHLYANLKIPERTTIEFFDGPHEIHGVGTYDFLHHHLKWPKSGDQEAAATGQGAKARTAAK